jgi:hypothetical protein
VVVDSEAVDWDSEADSGEAVDSEAGGWEAVDSEAGGWEAVDWDSEAAGGWEAVDWDSEAAALGSCKQSSYRLGCRI